MKPLPIPADRRVRVWFGKQVIADQVSDPASAAAYETAMRRRFASLRVTNESTYPETADS